MEQVIGIRFQEAGKIYYFSPLGFEDVEAGEYVVVETSRGLEVSRVVIAPSHVVSAELSEPLKPVTRLANADDLTRMERLKTKAHEDLVTVRRLVRERDLPMKVINASYNLDGSRLSVFFTSEGRVDFRDLLRELSHQLRAQVQLRQVGPRDQAKAVDGYGRCGRRLCCTSWLISFPAISIKMAKEQNLPLNPSKISGMCGRLLCCLAYEDDTYKQLKAQLPRPGSTVTTPSGDARVLAVNALRQVVTLQMESMEVVELPAAALAMDRGVVRLIAPAETEDDTAMVSAFAAPAEAAVPATGRAEGPPAGERPGRRGPRPAASEAQAGSAPPPTRGPQPSPARGGQTPADRRPRAPNVRPGPRPGSDRAAMRRRGRPWKSHHRRRRRGCPRRGDERRVAPAATAAAVAGRAAESPAPMTSPAHGGIGASLQPGCLIVSVTALPSADAKAPGPALRLGGPGGRGP
ncbi:MAG: regulatory iron-sulfur-containing complex subunit RicT [Dehalococcoidia bacterium]